MNASSQLLDNHKRVFALVSLGLLLAALLAPFLIAAPAVVAAPPSLNGKWRCIGRDSNGTSQAAWLVEASRISLTMEGNTLASPRLFGESCTFTLPPSAGNAIDIRIKIGEGQWLDCPAIYVLNGDKLRLCLPLGNRKPIRPTDFVSRPGDGNITLVFERIPPGTTRPETAAEQLGRVFEEARGNKLSADKAVPLAERCLQIAASRPRSDESVVSLLWILANAPESQAGKTALASLRNGEIAAANLETLGMCFGMQRGIIGPGSIPDAIDRELAPLLLDRVRQTPEHDKAAEVLSSVCFFAQSDEAADAPAVFDEAARMIATRWVKSPDILHFLEALSAARQRPWAARYEPTVRAIAAQSPVPHLRHWAAFTLAQLVAETGEARQEEARELYVKFVADYQPSLIDPSYASISADLVEQAKREIDGLLIRGIGGAAPALEGADLDGKPMALAEFHGKVVLLSFWATWCGPCMKLVPHERALVEQYKDRPFALIGVCGDKIEELDRQILAKQKITWRSFQNDRANRKSIASEWNLAGWPELYIIDHTGKIRRHWIGSPPQDEFDQEVARWVAVAEGKPLAPPLRPVAKAESYQGVSARFLNKKHGDSPYAICLPEDYDGKTPLPVVLFLHGSGQVGTDNQKQLGIGFGPAIRKYGLAFPFIGVFPQSAKSDWLATSAGGELAMMILGDVEREYKTDPRRVYLTGVSMGGEGVWSLAAAHPKRFAAIVPVCGGGDPKLAAALKDIPCWAFHGDADQMVPIQATRDIVKAITEAGGRPQFQVYSGVGHDCWDRVYGDGEMYRWLESQRLP